MLTAVCSFVQRDYPLQLLRAVDGDAKAKLDVWRRLQKSMARGINSSFFSLGKQKVSSTSAEDGHAMVMVKQ
jgi:hypothetical protein